MAGVVDGGGELVALEHHAGEDLFLDGVRADVVVGGKACLQGSVSVVNPGQEGHI